MTWNQENVGKQGYHLILIPKTYSTRFQFYQHQESTLVTRSLLVKCLIFQAMTRDKHPTHVIYLVF